MKKQRAYFIFLGLCLFLSAQSLFARELPIRIHLRDATKLNHERTFKYAKLTDGKSYALSRELILMEELALLATLHLDLKATSYIEKGVHIFKDDLIDMALTPTFKEHFEDNLAPTEHIQLDIKKLEKSWLALIKKDQLDTLYNEAVDMLDHGNLKEKNQNCLARHFVESVARGLLNLETHREKAKNHDLEDPKSLALSFISIQIRSLSWAYSLDRRAFPIQKENIPLFCQDVPVIPYK